MLLSRMGAACCSRKQSHCVVLDIYVRLLGILGDDELSSHPVVAYALGNGG